MTLESEVRKLFELLDTKDTTESGREFSPINITCCRAYLLEDLGVVLKNMKRLVGMERRQGGIGGHSQHEHR